MVRACSFSPDGQKLATGCQDKLVRIYNLNDEMISQQPANTKFNLKPSITLKGHGQTIKRIVWLDDETILTASDDKTVRKWNVGENFSLQCIHERTFEDGVSDVSKTGDILTVVAGKNVFFFKNDISELPFKQYQLPTKLNSAHLQQDQTTFVAGGEDLKLYRHSLTTGEELDSYKGHFGPIHIVRFSPDGKLYASGSEDGTIRLWQTVPGEQYGLWKGRQ